MGKTYDRFFNSLLAAIIVYLVARFTSLEIGLAVAVLVILLRVENARDDH